jgi:hypothetical protein
MQVWGQFQADDKGNLFFNRRLAAITLPVNRWKALSSARAYQGYLLAEDKQWIIPDLPDSIPEGLKVYVNVSN